MNLQPNQLCHIAGWGEAEAGTVVDDLRVVSVSVVDQNVCRCQWDGIPANVISAGGYRTLKEVCFVSFLSCFWNVYEHIMYFLCQNIKIFPFYRVILVVLWCCIFRR